MKKQLIQCINIKIAISLMRLLESSKADNAEVEFVKSYNEIALEAELRKATVSDTFNAKSKSGPNFITVLLIIKAMGYHITDFSKIFDSLTDTDIELFRRSKQV